jgi:hypothetical protein
MVFTISPDHLKDSIYLNHNALVPFYQIFNEEIIRIGPDSLPGYSGQLSRFTGDSMMRHVYSDIDHAWESYQKACRLTDQALSRWADVSGNKKPELVTFISGFNQTFITLPGILAIGIDNYLGAESSYYKELGIPLYLRKYMAPEFLAGDAVRAWLYSEIQGPDLEGGFLDRMIFEGKLYYIASELSGISAENLFHYTEQQLRWCREQENSMWKYLAEQKILFSSDRLTLRKFMEEAPFTRDFGNESPGRTGIWIGYRIVSSYMKATGATIKDLIGNSRAKEILSASKYHP